MNCDGVRGLLSAYLDGELSAGELLRVEQHLRRCHACADEVDSLRQTIALVGALDEVEVPASFQVQLHQRLVALGPPTAMRRTPEAPAWQRKVVTYAVPAVAAAAALAFSLTHGPDVEQLTNGVINESRSPVGLQSPDNIGTNPAGPKIGETDTPPPKLPEAATPSGSAEPSTPSTGNQPGTDKLSTLKPNSPSGDSDKASDQHAKTPIGLVNPNPGKAHPVTANPQPAVQPVAPTVALWQYSVPMSAGSSNPPELLGKLAVTYGPGVQQVAKVNPLSGMITTLISVPVDAFESTVQALTRLGFAQTGTVIKSDVSVTFERAAADLEAARQQYKDHVELMKLTPSDAVLQQTAKSEEEHLKARLDEATAAWERISEQAGTAQILISIHKQGQ